MANIAAAPPSVPVPRFLRKTGHDHLQGTPHVLLVLRIRIRTSNVVVEYQHTDMAEKL